MDLLTNEEIIARYPYLKNIISNTLIISEEERKQNKTGIKIRYDVNCNLEVETATLLNKLLKRDRYYEYVLKLFDDEITEFNISSIVNGDITPKKHLTKMQIVKGLEALTNTVNYEFDSRFYELLEELKKKVTLEKFISDYAFRQYKTNIDGESVVIPYINMINFLRLPQDYYEQCLSEEKLSGIKKEYFIYAILKFIDDENILNKYELDSDMVARIAEFKCYKDVDIQALNMLTKTEMPVSKQIKLNPSLHDEILKNMQKNLSDVEKAVYIYIKMCRMLTYDEEFYIEGQEGYVLDNHIESESIPKITPANNKVVCFEFTTMYAKFLEELGINYVICEKGIHSDLTFRCGKFIIGADSVVSILRGDLFQAKFNLPLNGLKCKNINIKTQDEFKSIIDSIYKMMPNQTNDIETETFEHIINEYKKTTDIKEVSLEEKMSILIEKVKKIRLEHVDYLSYILHLESILFTPKERNNNINITIIKRNDDNGERRSNVIFTINRNNIEESPKNNAYFCYDLNGNFVGLNKEQIIRMFETGTFSYISRDNHTIPGIKIGNEVSYERTSRTK